MHNQTSLLKKKQEYSIFTVCNLAYLSKVLVLAESVLKYNNVKLKVFLFDEKTDADLSHFEADFFWMEEMNVPNYNQIAFKYDIIEFSTSLKPFITLSLLKENDKVIFLDPDTCLFHSVEPILNDLDNHSIVLTPHYTTPQSDNPSESDTVMMKFGSFNLGFFGVRGSEQGLYFLDWWSKRSIDLSYTESQFGLFTDQKWVSIASCFFQDIYVSFNLGYNFAAWNSWERSLTKDAEGNYIVNNSTPLIFFHFSNFDNKDLEYFNKRSLYEKGVRRPDLFEIGKWYNQRLEANNTDIALTKYSYDYMSGGEYISPTLRRAYACILSEIPTNHNPFDSDSIVGKFARRNYLFEKHSTPFKRESFNSVSSNKSKLGLIHFLMRIVLRVVGPNKFMNLSRLLVYLSSYRQNRGLWKY
ncbi:MAG: hypothetical protein JWP44_4405 [Mucilaginibacter sp.]|nr:hypothetical protein [Mucilaginibacter sp.]